MSRMRMAVVAVLAAMVIATPAYQPAKAGPDVVEMVHAWWTEPVNMNPLVASEGFAYTFNMLVFDGLTELDEENVAQPALAERWVISPDGKRYTFFLRKDVTWQDGRPFTADDVVFTVYSHLNPKVTSSFYRSYEALEGFDRLTNRANPASPDSLPVKPVVALDKHTVVFRLRYPYAPFLSILQTYRGAIAPRHLLEGKNINDAEFNRQPVGTGRFRLVEWRRGDRAVFEANPRYYRGRPQIDRLIIRVIPDRNVAVEELKKGTVHFVYSAPFEARAEMERHPGIKNIFKPAPNWGGIILNFRNEIFQDRRVRQALMYAIDKNAMIRVVFRNYASVATGPITPAHGSWAFNSTIKPYDFSRERARALLAEAGWRPGPDGIMQKGGKRLSFLLSAAKREDYESMVTFVQEQWRRAGIEAKADLASQIATADKMRRGSFDAVYTVPSGWPDPDVETTNYLHSRGPANTQGYANPRVDELLERGRRLVTVKDRGPVYHELQKVLADDVPWIWLVWIPWMHSWSAKFTGYTGGPAFPVGNYYSLHRVRPVR
ncbi:MAG: hypothetical protein HY660_16080 [Armatimonadetes bacterium]|nr:hypothetical protein [Armatimonadota bacterium]